MRIEYGINIMDNTWEQKTKSEMKSICSDRIIAEQIEICLSRRW